jgi:ATP-binding cassette subfamily B protein
MKKQSTTKLTLKLFWQYTKNYKTYFSIGVLGSMLGVILQDIIPPLVVSKAFDKLQTSYSSHTLIDFRQLLPYAIVFGISMLLGLIIWRLQGYMVWEFEIKAQQDLIIDIFKHLEQQGQKFHSDRFGGALVSQTTKIVGGFERIMDELFWNITPTLTAFFAAIIVLLFTAPKYALMLFVVVLFYIAIMTWRIKHAFPYNRLESESNSTRTAILADAITNTDNIRAFANEEYELKRFTKYAKNTSDAYHKLAIETFKNDSISHSITNSVRILAFIFGLIAVTTYGANIAVLYLVIIYTTVVIEHLWSFGRIVRNVNRSLGDSAEMTDILQLEPEVKDPPRPLKVHIQRGSVEYKNVAFNYENKKTALFENLNLRIKPGEKIGLVGQSGGGKTSITKLLLRFMDIQKGQILIDNQDITTIRQTDLRKHITYVAQEPMLFHRSLKENIAYGNLQASQQEIEAVAKMAHAQEFIKDLPDGYNTLVGERGVKLSGGQRQRVAIARAMLKNAPILILDEATSALDSESEVLIQDALWKLMDNKTALVIAHRLSTIQKMDRIIVLDKGQIVEQGTHKELIRQNGVYSNLWNHQSGGFIEE